MLRLTTVMTSVLCRPTLIYQHYSKIRVISDVCQLIVSPGSQPDFVSRNILQMISNLRGGLSCSSAFVRSLKSAKASFCLAITRSCLSPRHRSPWACNSLDFRFYDNQQMSMYTVSTWYLSADSLRWAKIQTNRQRPVSVIPTDQSIIKYRFRFRNVTETHS